MSTHFLDLGYPVAVLERDDFGGDVAQTLRRMTENMSPVTRDLCVRLLQGAGREPVQHDHRGGDGAIPLGHPLRHGDHEYLQRHEGSTDLGFQLCEPLFVLPVHRDFHCFELIFAAPGQPEIAA